MKLPPTRNLALQLCLCGAAALFWELALIRWLGGSIRLVAYYTNFVLIAAFFGLGTGALLVRFRFRTWHFLVPLLALVVAGAPLLGIPEHLNPGDSAELVWHGAPRGIAQESSGSAGLGDRVQVPYWLVLGITYLLIACVFAMFGQWLGALFRAFPPLTAYTIEIGGSILGILLFVGMSWANAPPTLWFLAGFALVLAILDVGRGRLLRQALLAGAVVVGIWPFAGQFIWSRYYKIQTSPLTKVEDLEHRSVEFSPPIGMHLTVNNDYHQMILDLRPRPQEHPFLQSWRWTYEQPYRVVPPPPAGPILIVGAGTGNDVAAALRMQDGPIEALEIDPRIVEIGRREHPEQPYADGRVRVIVDDARSYFTRTDERYAMIVFGFLDSHTLMSSFSSLRLDNFVYTRESLERVKELLLPGGVVVLTFASNTRWLHRRIIDLLDSVFDFPTRTLGERRHRYSNGVLYINRTAIDPQNAPAARPLAAARGSIPTDDWPFLYMKAAALPAHYRVFIGMIVVMGVAALWLLPAGQRQVKLPYFFMGAGFFLIETSNVVSLSLLYGSTWIVNVAVFTGTLLLILLGSLTCRLMSRPRYSALFALLVVSVLIAWWTPTAALLGLESRLLQGLLAVTISLGPVYLASLIFGHLIRDEAELAQAYGSNLLGAVIGGSCEYASIVVGLKLLLLLTVVFYLAAFAVLALGRRRLPAT